VKGSGYTKAAIALGLVILMLGFGAIVAGCGGKTQRPRRYHDHSGADADYCSTDGNNGGADGDHRRTQ